MNTGGTRDRKKQKWDRIIDLVLSFLAEDEGSKLVLINSLTIP